MDLAPPKDKWHLIYVTLMVHGIGTVTTWNMFITAKDYFVDYKLANTQYAGNYLVYVGIASQLPNFVFSWLNAFVRMRGDLTSRIVVSLSVEVLIFLFTVVLAMLDSSQWPGTFFWLTMASVFMLNSCNEIFQNSVFGVAARLPPQYTGAVVLGSNVCGTLVVLVKWISDCVGGCKRTSAIYYFINGMFVLLICFDTYFALPLNRFYRYHDMRRQRTGPGEAAAARTPYGTIFRQAWVQLYNIWLVFFVSLAVFPAVHSDIYAVTPGFLGDNFTRITCFLTFNLTAMIGSITASLFQYPTRRWLSVFSTLRLAFIPFFLLCNYKPKEKNIFLPRTLPVLVNSDVAYWLAAVLLGWSSGHGSSLGMMYVSGTVAPEHAATAGMIGGATLITGIMTGIAFSYLGPIVATAELWQSA